MALVNYNVLTLQLLTPPQLPVSDIVNVLDLVLLPQLSYQGILDSVKSIGTFSQPSLMVVMVDGQLGMLAPIGTVTYAAATGAQTVVVNGVTASFTAGANDTATVLIAIAQINGQANLNSLVTATVNPAAPTVLILQARFPGTAQNGNTLVATSAGGKATVSAATLGGSAVSPARAGVAQSQINQLGIGTPSTP